MTAQHFDASRDEIKVVPVMFGTDLILAAEVRGEVFIAVKPIAESLGLDWSAQWRRIQRDVILSEGIAMMAMPLTAHGQETVCLRLDLVNGWLFGIDENRVKPEIKATVLRYKRECYRVLFEHFFRKTGADHAKPMEGEVIPPGGDMRAFPDWTMDEMRTRRGVVEMYRMTWGPQAGQWIAPQLGFPPPPAQFIERGRQMVLPFSSAAE